MNKNKKSLTSNRTRLPNKQQTVGVKRSIQQFSGPIPPPAILEHYKQILPSSPERIITMAEKEQEHKQQTISKLINSETTLKKSGQTFGFIIFIIITILGLYALYLGNTPFAILALIIAATPLIKIFILNKDSTKVEE